jgi:glycogenin
LAHAYWSFPTGALVLAHSLKDAGTTKKLTVLTVDVSADAMVQLQVSLTLTTVSNPLTPLTFYRSCLTSSFQSNESSTRRQPTFPSWIVLIYIRPSPRLFCGSCYSFGESFTWMRIWLLFVRLMSYSTLWNHFLQLRILDGLIFLILACICAKFVVMVMVLIRCIGLMVLTPNMGDYYALLAMAQRGISFDGADQGLLNMHFKNNFNRLSFSYNVTPSAHYQYLPAFRHFQSSISMAHFIGQEKPWHQGREAHRGSTPYDEMVGRWWAVYDRHYRESVRYFLSLSGISKITSSSQSRAPQKERHRSSNTTQRENFSLWLP